MESATLDKQDLEILAHLSKDGRKSFTDIAEEMGMAVNTIRNRYNRMVQEKVLHIIGWTDPTQTGYHAYARVDIQVKPADKLKSVCKKLLEIEEVSFLAITSGRYDLEMNLMCRSNSELLDILHQKIHSLEGVYDTDTTVYFEVLKWAFHDVSNTFGDRIRGLD